MQRLVERLGEDGDPVLHAFAGADGDVAVPEVEVLDPEPEHLAQAQAGAVEEHAGEAVLPRQLRKHGFHFSAGEHDGGPLRPLHPHDPLGAVGAPAGAVVPHRMQGC